MPAWLALQASVHPAHEQEHEQELVYPGAARLNRRIGGCGAGTERAHSQSCSTASGIAAPKPPSVTFALQALPPEGSVAQGTALLPRYICKEPP